MERNPNTIYFDDQGGEQMNEVKDECCPCLLSRNLQKGHSLIVAKCIPKIVAFAQNTREEVRVLGEDGNCAGCVSAEGGSHQTTYIVVGKKNVPRGTTDKHNTDFFAGCGHGVFCETKVSGTLASSQMTRVSNGIPCIAIIKNTKQ